MKGRGFWKVIINKKEGVMQRIYFVGQYSNEVHNINDYDHIIDFDGKSAEIGTWVADGASGKKDALSVSEEVSLFTLPEIAEFYI